MSGFGEERVVSGLIGGRSTGFLPKPFTIEELEKAIGAVVDDATGE
jgi:hypothetical protein